MLMFARFNGKPKEARKRAFMMWPCYLYAAITASTPLGKLSLEPAGIWSPSATIASMRSTTVLGIKVQLAVGRLIQLDG